MKLLIPYLLIINAISFLLMLIDKQKARKKKWRIPESTLFTAAALGGSLGGILGMKLFHHKTLHAKFKYGFPALFVVQVVLIGYLLLNGNL